MRSMFESASKPEVRNVVASIAKKPLVQKVAVSAARNEQVRNAALLSAQNPAVQRSMMDTLLNYSRPATTASGGSSQKPSVEEIARQFETKPIMGCRSGWSALSFDFMGIGYIDEINRYLLNTRNFLNYCYIRSIVICIILLYYIRFFNL